ncbi:nuclear localization sequence-binding protein-like isoform X2 [Maniola jurtina]|uniref:nuclear localization sequence-binding protein-like isoform X2 n=1 Tax=Maniola jurtina TaxID=191418 RepID=UPI001E68F343|nr:nuclear localization sequence-binding protein-like isoform X2 [Maniola jurtina]
MVARRGRGGKNTPAKPKTNQPEAAAEAEVAEQVETAEENNGEAPAEQTEDTTGGEEGAEEQSGQTEAGDQIKEEQPKPEEPKEEKVESGKLLVENLPPSYLFDYQDKLKELFSKHGEVTSVKRGPIIVTELTTTPTLSAIVEFKNKDSLEKALTEEGTVIDGCALSVAVESRAETAVLVGVPYEASTDYVRLLFAQCGDIAHIHEFSKTKYKILRVTFHEKEAVEKALKLDRELRINGFLVTVSKYRDEDEQKAHSANTNKNKRQHAQQNRNANNAAPAANTPPAPRPNNFRPRGGGGGFNARGNFRGGRGRGFGARGGSFPRGGFAPVNSYMPPQPFMGRPGYMNDGQRPNKRLRQM